MSYSKHIFITGGTGFIGQALCDRLLSQGHRITILSRHPEIVTERWSGQIAAIQNLEQLPDIPNPDWVINLAGEPIIDKPWTEQRKQQLIDSRVTLTKNLCQILSALPTPPEVMVSGSAIGFYGNTGNNVFTENSPQGQGFAAELCHDWEQAAINNLPAETRLCLLRTGVVLAPHGGMLAKISLPFKLGLGGRLGSGKQWMSWIALEDICRLIVFLLESQHCQGIYNATTPHPVTNQQLTKAYGKHIHRPTLFPMPAIVLKKLLGEASRLLLDSQRVLPQRISNTNFSFNYPELKHYLQNITHPN